MFDYKQKVFELVLANDILSARTRDEIARDKHRANIEWLKRAGLIKEYYYYFEQHLSKPKKWIDPDI